MDNPFPKCKKCETTKNDGLPLCRTCYPLYKHEFPGCVGCGELHKPLEKGMCSDCWDKVNRYSCESYLKRKAAREHVQQQNNKQE